MKPNNQLGFTIIELLIATTIFSVILLLVSFSVLQIGRTYYKGITSSTTQDTARSIMDTVAQDIEFSGQDIKVPAAYGAMPYALCIGNDRYSVAPNTQLVDSSPNALKHQALHALTEDQQACSPGSPSVGSGRELLAPHMRLAALTVTAGANNLYTVHVKVVYGDDDLLDPTMNSCVGGAGSQFCAVSDLQTNVQKRLQ